MPPKKRVKRSENESNSNSSSSAVSTGKIPQESQDCNCTNTINWEISIAEINGTRKCSHKVDIQGLPWLIFVYKSKTGGLSVFLNAMDNQSTMWTAEAEAEFTLRGHKDRSRDLKRLLSSGTYSHANNAWGFADMVMWDELINPEQGFIKDGKIKIDAQITVRRVTGIRKNPTFNFTTSNDPRHDLTLVIDGKKLFVSREFLSIHLPVFNAMLFGNFEEQNEEEVELKEVEYEDVLEMLQVMYPTGKKITDATIERLLAVGDYFQVKMILDQAEDYLIASTTFTVAAKLKLSGEYRLVHLQGLCLKSFAKIADIKKLKDAKEYNEFSEATKVSLLEKIMKLPE